MERDLANFSELSPEIKQKILKEAITDSDLVPKIADLLMENRQLYRSSQPDRRELANYIRIRETANPDSVMGLDLTVLPNGVSLNAHSQLWRGAQRFVEEYQGRVDLTDAQIQENRDRLNAMRHQYYQHLLLINRLNRDY